ncbi:MAG TPA: hypothetical protein VHD56_05205 [Tepidisphaeraceae bacterium]|nr:hypothetical protein [Tepidisphaeraceae bacterium]
MRNPIQYSVGFLNRMHRRMHRMRPGSILILVVVLVVLLALMGTAILSSTRSDRYTVQEHTSNTQIDLLVEGVKEMSKAAIVGDLYGQFNDGATPVYGYRLPADSAFDYKGGGTLTYGHWDMPVNVDPDALITAGVSGGIGIPDLVRLQQLKDAGDFWLSPRVPLAYEYQADPASPPLFAALGWPSLGKLPNVSTFESPFASAYTIDHSVVIPPATSLIKPTYSDRAPRWTLPGTSGQWFPMVPNWVRMQDGTNLPAWFVLEDAGVPAHYVLAGDADGDGVADSGLFKLPVGEIDGVTYYGAVRIIDNNSAVNVNTAYSRVEDLSINNGGSPPQWVDTFGRVVPAANIGTFNDLGTFRSHVGLRELLMDQDNTLATDIANPDPAHYPQMAAIQQYRMNKAPLGANNPPNNEPSEIPVADSYVSGNTVLAARGDFKFVTQGDAMEHQLSRRLDNPGFYGADQDKKYYLPFSAPDSTSLSYHFTLLNSDILRSPIEERLFRTALTTDALYKGVADFDSTTWTSPYKSRYPSDRSGIGNWFDDNFNYDGVVDSVNLPTQGAGTPPHFTINKNDPSRSPTYRRPLRALLTSYSTTSNLIPRREITATNIPAQYTTSTPDTEPDKIPLYGKQGRPAYPAKTDVNTASFGELWRAYWSVMSENTQTATPFADQVPTLPSFDPYAGMHFPRTPAPQLPSVNVPNPQRMFRSVIRDPRNTNAMFARFEPQTMVLLRSAMAAVQTLQLRDPNIQVRRSISTTMLNDAASPPAVNINIFGVRPQPFITEVVVWTDIGNAYDPQGGASHPAGPTDPHNTEPYVMIELYNPFNQDVQLTSDYQIMTLDRSQLSGAYTSTPQPNMLRSIHTFNGEIIPAGKFMILDNNPSAKIVTVPPEAGLGGSGGNYPSDAIHVTVPQLAQVLGRQLNRPLMGLEMQIVEQLAGTVGPSSMRPIDSYDFSGIDDYTANIYTTWHYVRPCGDEQRWQCVYPGRYMDGGGEGIRHQGTNYPPNPWNNTGDFDPWNALGNGDTVIPQPGQPKQKSHIPAYLPIQLANQDWPGPNAISGGAPKFPFGGFARNGDILQVPFIAAYTITIPDPANAANDILIEMNSISMDSAFAEDADPQDDFPGNTAAGAEQPEADKPGAREQVGRFCPLLIRDPVSGNILINDYDPDVDANTINSLHRYAWAKKLFDYLTVQSPASDYLPQAPATSNNTTPLNPLINPAQFPVRNGLEPTAGDPLGASGTKSYGESTAPVHGSININTAPWKVLAALPWAPAGQHRYLFIPPDQAIGGKSAAFVPNAANVNNGLDDNGEIAKAIVYWRDGDTTHPNNSNVGFAPASFGRGPFKTIFDLYRVRVPADAGETQLPTSAPNPYNPYIFQRIQDDIMNPSGGSGPPALADGPGNGQGDFSPLSTTDRDHSHYDFEEQYLLMTKVSNLITTRSDSFTVYIQVQGWSGVGTTTPRLVVQRRAAFIQDRSGVTPSTPGLPSAINVPND